MSMIGCYRRVSTAELEVLQAEPMALGAFLFPPGDVPPPVDRYLEVDKTWQAIHFLLTGDPWAGGPPFANAVLGGEELSDEDQGYGPARFLVPEEVAAVAAALATVPVEELLARYDADSLNAAEVYPGGWTGGPEDRAFIGEHYASLRELFANAAANGDGMILYVA